jgi:hypothetical protein
LALVATHTQQRGVIKSLNPFAFFPADKGAEKSPAKEGEAGGQI